MSINYISRGLRGSTALVHPTLAGGSIKKTLGIVIGVVAAIAIPFIAAPIATALFGGASVIGSAIVGAGLGAVAGGGAAAISGGNIMQGALFGGLAGGIAGGISGLGAVQAASAPADLLANPLPGSGAAASQAAAAGAGVASGTSPNLATATTGTASTAGTAANVAATTAKSVTMSRITDSLLNAAPQMIGQIAASMSAPDQADYLAQLEQEMNDYKGKDEAAYQARLNIYNQFMTKAQEDPAFDALLAQARVQRTGAQRYQQLQADNALTDRGSGTNEYNARKFAVENTKSAYSAYADAYRTGRDKQDAALAQAANLYPGASMQNANNTLAMYRIAGENRDAVAGGASRMAAGLIAPFGSKYAGPTDSKVQETKAGLSYGNLYG